MDPANELYFADTLQSESTLLAELIADPASIPTVQKAVSPEMFNDVHARAVFTMLGDLFAAGAAEVITMATVYGRIKDDRDKEFYRAKVMTAVPTCSYLVVKDCSDRIRNAYECRRIYDLAASLQASAMAGTEIPEALERIRAFQEEGAKAAGAKAVTVAEAFNGLCKDLQDRKGHTPTGFPSLDRATYGGFADGNLIILAARPSVGKTSVGLDIARSMSYNGAKVVFFSLEMTASEIAQKLLLGTDRLTGDDFKGEADALDWDRIEAAGAEAARVNLLIDDRSYTLDEICTQIVLLHSQGKCSAAFVDYLGLVEVSKDTRTPLAIKLATATRRLKMLAKDLGIPVVVLAQLNRESAKDHRSPELFDLRDSGAIEQDANIVLMLEREGNDLESRGVFVWVRKNRSGQAGNFRIDLEANATFSRFTEREYNPSGASPVPTTAPQYEREYNPDEYHEPAAAMEAVQTEFDY